MTQDRNKLVWRKFIKYKIIEILLVLLIIPVFHYIAILTQQFLIKSSADFSSYSQTEIYISSGIIGILSLIVLILFIYFISVLINAWIRFNWEKATETVEQELKNKKEE